MKLKPSFEILKVFLNRSSVCMCSILSAISGCFSANAGKIVNELYPYLFFAYVRAMKVHPKKAKESPASFVMQHTRRLSDDILLRRFLRERALMKAILSFKPNNWKVELWREISYQTQSLGVVLLGPTQDSRLLYIMLPFSYLNAPL